MLLANDVADAEATDAAWTLGTGAPLGSFRILDIVGLTTACNIVAASPAAQEPGSTAARIAALLKERIDAGKMGINADKDSIAIGRAWPCMLGREAYRAAAWQGLAVQLLCCGEGQD